MNSATLDHATEAELSAVSRLFRAQADLDLAVLECEPEGRLAACEELIAAELALAEVRKTHSP